MKTWFPRLITLLLICIAAFSLLGQFGRSMTPFGYVSWYEVFIFIFVLCSLPVIKVSLPKKDQSVLFVLGLFFIWALSTTLFHKEVALIGTAYLARMFLYVCLCFSLKNILDAQIISYSFLKTGISLWLSIFAALGIFQFLFLPDTRIFFYLGWDDHLSRAFGTLFDPGYFGLLMVAGVLFTLWDARVQKYWWHQVQLAVYIMATALSYSRASYLGLCVGILAFSYFTKKKKMLLMIPLFIMSLVLLPMDGGGEGQNLVRTQTVAMRREVAEIHTRSFRGMDHIIGKGWYYEKALSLHAQELGEKQNVVKRQNSGGVDNAFLHVFFSTGYIGSVLFLGTLFMLLKKSQNTFWKSLLAAVSAHSFFSLGLFYPWIMLILAITFFLREEPSPHQKTT